MTVDVFWQRIETAIISGGGCKICPAQEYADEKNAERMCDRVDDCADGLKMLYEHLKQEADDEN
jgi:hypothetical protein